MESPAFQGALPESSSGNVIKTISLLFTIRRHIQPMEAGTLGEESNELEVRL
jgi:hypothetical protein